MTWELISFYSYLHCSYFLSLLLGNQLNIVNMHLFICTCFYKNEYVCAWIFNKRIYTLKKKKDKPGNFLAVQWLRLCAFTAEGTGSIPGQGTKLLQAAQHSQ